MNFNNFAKNKKAVSVILILIFAAATAYYFNLPQFLKEGKERSDIVNLVETFGKRFKNVPLLASRDMLAESMSVNYADLVSSPVLLAQWVAEAQTNPINVPGRLTSSPWPDRIEITNIEKISEYAYEAKGDVIEITIGDKNDYAAKRPITILAEKRRDLNNRWLISNVILGPYENSNNPANQENIRLEKAIADYLLTQKHFSWKTQESSFNFCSVENLNKENNLFPMYVWAYCAEYLIENGELKTLSGSSGPAKILYPNELSYFNLINFSYETPEDGSNYAKDIKRIFPQNIQETILNYNKKNIIQKNEAIAILNNSAWQSIKQAIDSCEVKSLFQNHNREVSVKLKKGIELKAVEPKIDEIMDIAALASQKCGNIIMATE